MLHQVAVGSQTLRGISVGGIYTALQVRELDVLLDIGIAPRSFVGTDTLLLSHGHADHVGALPALLGIRMLLGNRRLRLIAPGEISAELRDILRIVSKLQGSEVNVDLIEMEPGAEVQLGGNLVVRAFRTFHPVPSLGYLLLRRIKKLRQEHIGMAGEEIKRRRLAGEDLFDVVDRHELAYATDSLPRVLDDEPDLTRVGTLVLECTFLDDRKNAEAAHRSCHVHLDDLIERADAFRNDRIVLIHFSQLYKPQEVEEILAARCPEALAKRVIPFLPSLPVWPG